MKKLNKKGFTLVELLAVIVILAVIMVITIPTVLSSMDKATDSAFESAVTTLEDYVNKNYDLCKLGGTLGDGYDTKLFTSDCYLNVTVEKVGTEFVLDVNSLDHEDFLDKTNYTGEFKEVYIKATLVQIAGADTETDDTDDEYGLKLADGRTKIVAEAADGGQFKGKKSTGLPDKNSIDTYFGGRSNAADAGTATYKTLSGIDQDVYVALDQNY